jgi:hypothetical protein
VTTFSFGTAELDYGCGVTVVGNFSYNYYSETDFLNPSHLFSGTGFFISSFINNEICREAYNRINKKFQIVWQSPVKVNNKTGNKFFFIVYRKK